MNGIIKDSYSPSHFLMADTAAVASAVVLAAGAGAAAVTLASTTAGHLWLLMGSWLVGLGGRF